MFENSLNPFYISLKLSLITTIILFIIAFPIAYFFVYKEFKCKFLIETLISLPLVMPPTVLGFYLLILLSPESFIGKFLLNVFGLKIVFTFTGIVIASCVACFPFMFLPIKNGFESIDKRLLEASATLGKNKLQTLIKVIIPNVLPYIYIAPITTFARTIGAFGVVIMVGGSIPGVTKVASIAIYEKVEELKYIDANKYSLMLLLISFIFMILTNYLQKKYKRIEQL